MIDGIRTHLDVLEDLLEVLEEVEPFGLGRHEEIRCEFCGLYESKRITVDGEERQHEPDCKYVVGQRELKAMIAVENAAWTRWIENRRANNPESEAGYQQLLAAARASGLDVFPPPAEKDPE